MNQVNWKTLSLRRLSGLGLMAAGVFVIIMLGQWMISLLGVFFIGLGIYGFVQTLRTDDKTNTIVTYLLGVGSILLGVIVFLSPLTVLSGLTLAISAFFVIDGCIRLYGAVRATGRDRWWKLFNGLVTVALGFLIWFLISAQLEVLALGIVLGVRLIMEGWTMFFLPEKGLGEVTETPDLSMHPDARLGLEPGDDMQSAYEEIMRNESAVTRQDIFWSLTLLLILFAVHAVRVSAQWSIVGLVSPFVAVFGDVVVALILGITLILPARLFWRKLTRPVERTAWKRMRELNALKEDPTVGEQCLKYWVETRMRFAHELKAIRLSLSYAFWRLLRFGLPLTAVLVAINTIWGFSWYFNSENWASGVFQEISRRKVDAWRRRNAEDVEKAAVADGVPADKVFAVEPDGVIDTGDFSFVVIGDTGEGDSSQASLKDQLIAVGNRDDVKFLVVSSDVIYPDGRMKDYEFNFYLPFKGFQKPIYAIPGNHDWYDANEGFNANFLEPKSADIALRGRLAEDLHTDIVSTDKRFREIINESQRLRDYYRVSTGHQRAPFFEIQTRGFSLIAVDTGISRRIDDKEKAWLVEALERSGSNFKFVILGHPIFVAGKDTAKDDDDFREIHDILRRSSVDVAMAGDTHDFEFYKERYGSGANAREMYHFVNGGGGAYLSVGTAVDFPKDPFTPDYAFYPRTDEVTAKIKGEAPFWKLPFLAWMQILGGWPFDQEAVSGAFDFNRAPFFQSFIVVNVERSKQRVRLELYGVNGKLRWKDIQIGGDVKPPDVRDDEPAEFVRPLYPAPPH